MVVFDRVTPHLNAPTVHLDNEEGGFIATEHLLEQGYKRIAILAGPKNLGISNSRMNGYLNALKKYKIKVDPNLIIHCDFNLPPLKTDVEYPGKQGILFAKGVSGWWWGKVEECRSLLLNILKEYTIVK